MFQTQDTTLTDITKYTEDKSELIVNNSKFLEKILLTRDQVIVKFMANKKGLPKLKKKCPFAVLCIDRNCKSYIYFLFSDESLENRS